MNKVFLRNYNGYEELEYLGSRVTLLKELAERICREQIAQFADIQSHA